MEEVSAYMSVQAYYPVSQARVYFRQASVGVLALRQLCVLARICCLLNSIVRCKTGVLDGKTKGVPSLLR